MAAGGTSGGSRVVGGKPGYVLMVVPGRPGGIDRVIDYLVGAWPQSPTLPPVRLARSRGRSRLGSPFHLGAVLLLLLVDGMRGRIALAHINMASRGSTVRKFILVAAARLVGVPYVLHLHGGGFREFHASLPRPARRPVDWIFHHAARVLVLGNVWRRWVEVEVGVAAEWIQVLPNGVPDPLAGAPVPVRQPNRAPMLLFLGRMGPRKGVDDLLQALAASPMQGTAWRAVLAGDGDVARTRALVAELGLSDRVDVAGWLDPAQTRAALAKADLFVLPSYAEGLSVAVLEAMAWALPVVVTPVGAHGEVVRSGETGILVDPGDVAALGQAMYRLITQPEDRRCMGQAGRQRFLANYELASVLRQLGACYAQIPMRTRG